MTDELQIGEHATPLPVPYARQFSFTDWSANHPNEPVPGQYLDIEFDNVLHAMGSTQTRLVQLLRDGGFIGLNELVDAVRKLQAQCAALETRLSALESRP